MIHVIWRRQVLEQMVLQLNNTFTQDTQDIAEAQTWYMSGKNGC
jgi:hypothetical protein